MASKKETVETVDEQGQPLKLDVKHPSGKNMQEAQLLYTLHWQELVDKGVKVKRQIDELLEQQGIWTKKQENEKKHLIERIISLGKELGDKTVKKTKARGREISIEILKTRAKLQNLLRERTELDSNHAESLAENVRFDYLVSVCTVYNTNGEPYFKDYDDYVARRDEKAAWAAASKLATMLYGGDFSENFEDNLIEVQFLKQFKFIDDEKNFINEKGERVDLDNKPVTPTVKDVDVFGFPIIDGKSQYEFEGFEDEAPPKEQETKKVPTPKNVEAQTEEK